MDEKRGLGGDSAGCLGYRSGNYQEVVCSVIYQDGGVSIAESLIVLNKLLNSLFNL